MDCPAFEPGDMDFCLQCPYYFDCEWRDAVPKIPVLETDIIYFMEEA